MIIKRTIISIIICLLLLPFINCRNAPAMTPPPGFAVYMKTSVTSSEFKAVSPEGLRLRAGKRPNDPPGDTELWMRAIRLHFEQVGYQIIEEKRVKTETGLEGLSIRLMHHLQNDDYVYQVTIFTDKDFVYAVEAAAPADVFRKYEKELSASIQTFRIAEAGAGAGSK